jgi:hypothetical protein
VVLAIMALLMLGGYLATVVVIGDPPGRSPVDLPVER